MKQKDAVFAALVAVFGQIEGNVNATITKEQRAQVNVILFEGFRSGEIDLDREFDDKGLKTYCSGLQSNWLRKDLRLNGGVEYEAKNPGSRAGSGDSTLTAIRNLKKATDPTDERYQMILDAEAVQLAKIAEKKVVKVDYSKLPAELAEKFAQKV